MTRQTLTALTLAALALAARPALADEIPWGEEGGEPDAWTPPPGPPPGSDDEGYDVSVASDGGVSLSTFQQPLASYGAWVTAPGYGQVWRPSVPAGWRPYYYGRWEWTTEGWLWVSDEPFGWATYHYGRWTWDRGLGWYWVPGYQWAPAWVSWRYSGDVVGWSPLAPGLSLYVTDTAFVDFWWTFVPTVRFCGGPVYGMAYAPGHSSHWYHATRPAPPRPAPPGGYRPVPGRPPPPAWGGPAPRFVEERSGRPVRPARIVTAPSPTGARVRPGEIGVYRPEVGGGRSRDARPGAAVGAPGAEPFRPGGGASRGPAPAAGRPVYRPEGWPQGGAAERAQQAIRPPPASGRAPEGSGAPGYRPERAPGYAPAPRAAPYPGGWTAPGSAQPPPSRAPSALPPSAAPSYAPAPSAAPPPSRAPPPSSRGGGSGGGHGGGRDRGR